MLKGKTVDLELIERGELDIVKGWDNDPGFVGEFEGFDQVSLSDLETKYDNRGDAQYYFVKKKDGTRIGLITQFKDGTDIGIGYMLVPGERGKGYGSEAVQLIVDYVFLTRDTVRIQAETHPDNVASQRVLEKAGFVKEGIRRKAFFSRGVWRDTAMWSVLREDWKSPKLLPMGYIRK